jgi:hypothetical protein
MVTVSHLAFTNPLEGCSGRSVQLFVRYGLVHYLSIARLIGGCHSFITPATDCMSTKIAGGANVTGVDVAVYESSLALAVTRSTFKDVHLTAFDVHNGWSGPEEGINRCDPMFHESRCDFQY